MVKTVFEKETLIRTDEDGNLALVARRCQNCGFTTFPPTVNTCMRCWSTNLEAVLVGKRGRLYSYTTVARAPQPQRQVPYTVGLVDLPEGPRIHARIEHDRPPQINEEVHLRASGDESVGFAYEVAR